MTGFARAQGQIDGPQGGSWAWEARSVNGRGLDLRVRLPQGFDTLDGPARAAIAQRFKRGNVTLSLNYEAARDTSAPVINQTLLETLATAAQDVARRFPDLAPARIDGLLAVRGVLETADGAADGADTVEARAARDQALLVGLDQALDALAAARQEEGGRLAPVLAGILDHIDALRTKASGLASNQPEAIRDRLRAQIAPVLEVLSGQPSGTVPAQAEDRLYQEAAILASKADIREELDRLAAHVQAARDLLALEGPVGRRLDFLCQEFNREANTLCSKAAETAMTALGLDLKAAIDQLREQVQNIE
ncbi:YicC family protein [Roseospira marina]|uniref:YicC family protein n=2 Tax=Roseospira marina TaxID=140057 RepID=A0A5M6I6A0_9PROT|nr:YicC family protein [Roseospira marina]